MSPLEYFSFHYAIILESLIVPILSIWPLDRISNKIKKIEDKKHLLTKTVLRYLNICFIGFIPSVALLLILACLIDSFRFKISWMPSLAFDIVLVLYFSLAFFLGIFIIGFASLPIKNWLIMSMTWAVPRMSRVLKVNRLARIEQLRQHIIKIAVQMREYMYVDKWLLKIMGVVIVVCILAIFYIPTGKWAYAHFISNLNRCSKIENLRVKFKKCRYITYNPTNYNPKVKPIKFPFKSSVIRDLEVLRELGFNGLLIFSALDVDLYDDYIPPILYKEEYEEIISELPNDKVIIDNYQIVNDIEDCRVYYALQDIGFDQKRILSKFFTGEFIPSSKVEKRWKEIRSLYNKLDKAEFDSYMNSISDKAVKDIFKDSYEEKINLGTNEKYYSLKGLSVGDIDTLVNIFKGRFASFYEIPRMGRTLKDKSFDSIILSLWAVESSIIANPEVKRDYNEQAARELRNASLPYVVENVDGYCVGHNELNKSYDIEELKKAMNKLKENTGKPVSTTQSVADYYSNPELYNISDWLSPDIHGYWYVIEFKDFNNAEAYADIRSSKEAGDEVLKSVKQLQEQLLYDKLANKPVLVKFIGYPSKGTVVDTRFSEVAQEAFFDYFIRHIQKNVVFSNSNISFSYFDAFDTPWKREDFRNYPEEMHVGIFSADRTPKPAAKVLKQLL